MTTFGDIALSRKSTAEQVAEGLAGKILRGELAPGEPIRESAVAASLGVSRNTVRESMRLLERSSLITYEFNRGAVVKRPSLAELQEVYRARQVLEVAAARNSDPGAVAVATLEAAFDRLADAAGSGEPAEIVAADLAFHAALVGLAGSSRLDHYYAELARELAFYLMVLSVGEREHERPEGLLDEHRVILEAVKAEDPERAGQLVAEHIDSNGRRVERLLRARDA